MRVLLTRAAEDAARTRAKLEAAGHRVIVSSVIEIVPTGARWPTGVVDAVLATSGQAFAVMEDWDTPLPEARRLMPLFLVGERTADLARSRGFLGSATVVANVGALAIAVGKLPATSQRLLYLAGRDRKPDIETALDVIGRPPEVVEVYEARETGALSPEAKDMLMQGHASAVLHFSRRSAGLFRDRARAAGVDIQPLVHLCLSDDVAGPLVQAGCRDVRVAEAPNETALLTLVGEA